MEAASEVTRADSVCTTNIGDVVHGVVAGIESLHIDDQLYNDIVEKAEVRLRKDCEFPVDLKYKLITEATALLEDVENKILRISGFIHQNYSPHYSELDFLAKDDPVTYARVAKKIGNEIDLTRVDLEGILSYTQYQHFKSLLSTTNFADRKQLSEDVLQKTLQACDIFIELDSMKKRLVDFLESKMMHVAPNLSAVVGSVVAAKLMVSAGGLAALANMPAVDIQRLGVKAKILAGASPFLRVGYIMEAEVFHRTINKLRGCHLLIGMSIRAAQVDCTRGDPTGETGRTFLEEIHKQLRYSLLA